jgi:hypothetical protein
MTRQEYDSKLKEMELDFDRRKTQLAKEFALSNNGYKVGDVFADHIGRIRIEKISFYFSYKEPSCVYFGLILNKDGSPNKRGKKREAFQINEESTTP